MIQSKLIIAWEEASRSSTLLPIRRQTQFFSFSQIESRLINKCDLIRTNHNSFMKKLKVRWRWFPFCLSFDSCAINRGERLGKKSTESYCLLHKALPVLRFRPRSFRDININSRCTIYLKISYMGHRISPLNSSFPIYQYLIRVDVVGMSIPKSRSLGLVPRVFGASVEIVSK